METLNYDVLKRSGYDGYVLEKGAAPIRVFQFGEGNFLRAFVDYWFDLCNERTDWNGRIALSQLTTEGRSKEINAQESLYTLYLVGLQNGERVGYKRVISVLDTCYDPYCVCDWEKMKSIFRSRDLEYVVTNTTEAGIVYDASSNMGQMPPASFPAKLTSLLFERYKSNRAGLVILSCELIDNNGQELKNCVLKHARAWGLGEDFRRWIENENLFCTTLVDRIVPGKVRDPKNEENLNLANGYIDNLMDVAEVFGVWYIEGPEYLTEKLPFAKAGLEVHVVPDASPYKTQKVRILNGAHTGIVPAAYLLGENTVRGCMQNDVVHRYMDRLLYDEIIPGLPLDEEKCRDFARVVTERFANPYIEHQLINIALNSTAKWKTRNLPSLLVYWEKFGKLPDALCMSFAAYIAFYSNDLVSRKGNGILARRPSGEEYLIRDVDWVLDFYWAHRDAGVKTLVHAVLFNKKMWGQDLNLIPGLMAKVAEDLTLIRTKGAEAAMVSVLEGDGN